ncbi:MAG: efflux RND transporter periplasmic adaptor subunit [Acidobacteriota bacterium]|nr:efflux RND transporter periplasmic adaptor subunit [Acidobacteriota bacterium]
MNRRLVGLIIFGLLGTGAWSGCGPVSESHLQRHEDGHHEEDHDAEASGHHDEHGDGHHDEHGGESATVTLSPEAQKRIGLATAAVAQLPLRALRTTTGTLGFDETRLARVGPRVDGRLVRVPGELGERVAAGEILAVLDSVELGEAKARYLSAQARREVAQQRYERELSLRTDRIASEQEVLDAEGAAREATADLAAARETLRLLGLGEATIDGLSWQDGDAAQVAVRAPFAGKIVERNATLGELVDPRSELFTLADLSQVWLWVDLYERDLAHVDLGQPVEVRLDAWGDEVFHGELAYIADQVEAESRTVGARVDLPNPDGRLKPGMFARVSLATGEPQERSVLVVPREAIQRDGEESIVFVSTNSPGRFERRAVQVGDVAEALAEIVSGLEAGDEVVTEGAFLLRSQASADELGGHHHH